MVKHGKADGSLRIHKGCIESAHIHVLRRLSQNIIFSKAVCQINMYSLQSVDSFIHAIASSPNPLHEPQSPLKVTTPCLLYSTACALQVLKPISTYYGYNIQKRTLYTEKLYRNASYEAGLVDFDPALCHTGICRVQTFSVLTSHAKEALQVLELLDGDLQTRNIMEHENIARPFKYLSMNQNWRIILSKENKHLTNITWNSLKHRLSGVECSGEEAIPESCLASQSWVSPY